MKCSSMVSTAAFGPRDPGSNPVLVYCLKFESRMKFSQIIQVYGTLACTVTQPCRW